MDDRQTGSYERVFLGIAIVVTAVWALATLVQVIVPAHVVPTYANLVMMVVASSFFGGAVISSRRKNGKDKPAEPEATLTPLTEPNDEDPYEGPGGYYRAGG